ncbi:odorant receptor 45a-like [Haematobia irritans]|uniref:odorant receptor 45a-like n=1 Tax=Haematobia irritans TaxID=7368 RepID=UPI003F501E3E
MSILPRAPDSLPSQRVLQGYFFVQKYSFAAIGIDPTSLKRTIYNPYRAWIPLLSIVTVCIPVFLYASKYVDDLLQMTNILAPIWQSLLGIIKFFLFMWNRKKIVELVRKLWQRNLEANDEELKILVEENSYDTKISIFYYTSVFISAVLATLLPFMTAGFYAWKGYSFWESLDPPFKGVYLVDPHNSYWAYAFAFIWNALGIYYVLNGTLAIDTLFSWFMRNISAQFRILNLKFELIAKDVASMKTQNLELDRSSMKSTNTLC